MALETKVLELNLHNNSNEQYSGYFLSGLQGKAQRDYIRAPCAVDSLKNQTGNDLNLISMPKGHGIALTP